MIFFITIIASLLGRQYYLLIAGGYNNSNNSIEKIIISINETQTTIIDDIEVIRNNNNTNGSSTPTTVPEREKGDSWGRQQQQHSFLPTSNSLMMKNETKQQQQQENPYDDHHSSSSTKNNLEYRKKAGPGVLSQLFIPTTAAATTTNKASSSSSNSNSSSSSKYKSAILCIPGKVGSTSFYNFLYQTLNEGKSWTYQGRPYIQQIPNNKRWGKRTFNRSTMSDRDLIHFVTTTNSRKNVFSLALIRDPKERLLSSWKSKFACPSEGYRTDTNDSPLMIKHLFHLAGAGTVEESNSLTSSSSLSSGNNNNNDSIIGNIPLLSSSPLPKCLSLEQFLDILLIIHRSTATTTIIDKKKKKKNRDGYYDYHHHHPKADDLDRHIRPQNLCCFRHTNPKQWSYVTTISNPDLPRVIQELILTGHVVTTASGTATKMNTTTPTAAITEMNDATATATTKPSIIPKSHVSDNLQSSKPHQNKSSIIDMLSKNYQTILDEITSDEYNLLSEYL